jgi:hypothetical protein
MTENEGKKGPGIAELAAAVGVMVSILIASTTLLNNSGNLPSWWFSFSLIVLIALIFFMPVMIFARPVYDQIRYVRLGRKRNSVSREHASEFKDLVERSRRFSYDIRNIMNSFRNYYTNDIKSLLTISLLQDYGQQRIDNVMFNIEKDIDKSDKTFRDLYLIMMHFESVSDIHKRNLEIIEVFAHEMMTTTQKPIPKGIEAEFETFREKYNYFVKDITDFYHKVNQESESNVFPEHSFEHLKKW